MVGDPRCNAGADFCCVAVARLDPRRGGFLPAVPRTAGCHRPLPVLEDLQPRMAHVRAASRDRSQDGRPPARAERRARGSQDVGQPAPARPRRLLLDSDVIYGGKGNGHLQDAQQLRDFDVR